MIADQLIIPSTAGIFAATGIQQLKLYVDSIIPYRKRTTNLKIDGILITKYNPRTVINKGMKEFTEQLATIINTRVYNTYIRFSVAVEEAQAEKCDLYKYSNSSVAEDYNTFIDEYLGG